MNCTIHRTRQGPILVEVLFLRVFLFGSISCLRRGTLSLPFALCKGLEILSFSIVGNRQKTDYPLAFWRPLTIRYTGSVELHWPCVGVFSSQLYLFTVVRKSSSALFHRKNPRKLLLIGRFCYSQVKNINQRFFTQFLMLGFIRENF